MTSLNCFGSEVIGSSATTPGDVRAPAALADPEVAQVTPREALARKRFDGRRDVKGRRGAASGGVTSPPLAAYWW